MEASSMPTGRGMDKEVVVHMVHIVPHIIHIIHSGILLSYKKECI